MKKLVAFAAVIAAVSFVSCGNKSAENTEVAETETEATIEEWLLLLKKLQQKRLQLLKVIQLLLKFRRLKLKLLLLNNHSAISDEDSLYACNIQTFLFLNLCNLCI